MEYPSLNQYIDAIQYADSFEGIVLTETNYSESSKILNVLTKDLGIIGVMSKGCRKVKSNLRVVSNKLTYGDFNIYYKKNTYNDIKNIFRQS